VTTVTADDVRRWLVSLRGKVAPSTEYRNYSGLRQFFAWCVREDELDVSPLANIKPPKVPEPHTAMLTKEPTKTLLPSCAGKDLISHRDTAIILLLADTGMRRSELANLTTEDLDLRGRPVCVEGKGDASHRKRFRMVPLGARAAQGLDRYLRSRRQHFACRPAVAVAFAAGTVHLGRHRPDARAPRAGDRRAAARAHVPPPVRRCVVERPAAPRATCRSWPGGARAPCSAGMRREPAERAREAHRRLLPMDSL